MSVLTFDEVNKNVGKTLDKSFKRQAGRNNQGKITIRHRGGHKQLYRMIDFSQLDKREYLEKWQLLNMIQIVPRSLCLSIMLMGRNVITWRRKICGRKRHND